MTEEIIYDFISKLSNIRDGKVIIAAADLKSTIETIGVLNARIAELEAALKDATVRLVAAISLLERGGKKAAPSNKMFEQMLVDYKNGVERARAALGEKE